MSSSSVFVSCADYDDDINANKAEIVAAQNEIAKLTSNLNSLQTELKQQKADLEAQLTTLQSTFNTKIADVKAELNTAIEQKADQSYVDSKVAELNNLLNQQAAEISTLKAKIASIDTALANLEKLIATKADQTALDAAIQTLTAAINGKVDKETYNEAVARISALETLLTSLKSDIETLRADKAALADVNSKIELVNKDIAALQEALKDKVSTETFNSLKATVEGIQTTLANVQAAFQAALDKKADQATVDALKTELQSKIDALAKQLENYVTKDQLDAAISRIEGLIASLQNNKADKEEVAALKATLVTIQTAVADLQANKADKEAVNAALESLRKEVEALVASKADKTEIVRLDNLLEKLEALVIAKEAAIYNEMDVREAAINALIAALEANKADRTELEAAKESLEKALEEAVTKLNEDIATKYAELTGRVDKAFEELSDIRGQIVDILAQIAATNGEVERVEGKFDKLIADLQEADKTLDGKIEKLDGIVNGHLEAYKVAMAALNEQIAALQLFQKEMQETVIPGLEEALAKASKELGDKIQKETEERQAAITDVMGEIQKTNSDIATKYAELQKYLAEKEADALEKYNDLNGRVKELETQFSKINDLIDARIKENVTSLCVYVSKVLKSISLLPQLYIGGIEAIEFNSLSYIPAVPGTSGLTNEHLSHIQRKGTEITVDNGTAEAYYTLSPAAVDPKTIDVEKIHYKSAIAQTRSEEFEKSIQKESPVAFAGVADWAVQGQKGLIKVNLKKTITGSLNLNGGDGQEYGGPVYIVNLNVPRKASTVAGNEVDKEDAVITSENHMLAERTFTPRIAHAHWGAKQGEWVGGPDNKEYVTWYDPATKTQTIDGYNLHHFSDSVTIWSQRVDADPNAGSNRQRLDLVTTCLPYNQVFNVSKIVTACDIETPRDIMGKFAGIDDPDGVDYHANHTSDHEISLAKLKSFGLEFRYYIPTTPYKNTVDHSTDQQKFAKIDPITGILTSVVPQLDGTSIVDNRACVGKEPIIRVELVDVVNNKIVDQRYLKIKWIEPTKGERDLGEYEVTTELKPCDLNGPVGVEWLWFIDKAYSKADVSGMSQNLFSQIYMNKDALPTVGKVSYTGTHKDLLSPKAEPVGPEVKQTTNENGDALIAVWQLEPKQIANIYPAQTKTFTAKITFHSIIPTEYPDLTMTFKWTITLPPFPEINGYYNTYWFTKYSLHDVMPVQYNTPMYHLIKNGTVVPGKEIAGAYGKNAPEVGMQIYNKENNALYVDGTITEPFDYCVFYNAITNAFTYEQKNGAPQFIVKNLGGCATWDMQFTYPGADFIDNSKTYPQVKVGSNQYRPASNTNSPALSKIKWYEAGAYKLEDSNQKQALQLEWWGEMDTKTGKFKQDDDKHVAWDGLMPYNYAMLYADHHNAANQALLNPIVPKGIGVEPDRTHEKKVHMGVWGTLNDWNIIPVKDYDFCLVEPLAINANLEGAFEEGYVSGTVVRCDDAFRMTDFRGYEVSQAKADVNASEWSKYRFDLYKYYEVGQPKWDLANVKYGLKIDGGNLVPDNAAKIKADQISALTNGNARLSVDEKTFDGVKYLRFKNNEGSNTEEPFWIYIPVSAEYGFGKVEMESKVKVYPKGKVEPGVTIMAYPGGADE
jgi:septal ring factor EnvC (AmiA/AmiB activator)